MTDYTTGRDTALARVQLMEHVAAVSAEVEAAQESLMEKARARTDAAWAAVNGGVRKTDLAQFLGITPSKITRMLQRNGHAVEAE